MVGKISVRKKVVISGVVLVCLIIFAAKKIYLYAADPLGEKDCPPLFPGSENNINGNRIEVEMPTSTLHWFQIGGTINDASCLNKTSVYGIVEVKNEEDARNALMYAKEHSLKVSPAGVKHSMGGQAFARNALVLDMRQLNVMSLDEASKILTVGSGATWHDIQQFLHPKFAVKAMQSTDIFTVGGSISVNAHGMDHRVGSLGKTLHSMRVMMADGSIQKVSRTENPELFKLIIGGYGLFGVVLDAEIEVTENVVYESERKIINYKEFERIFNDEILTDPSIGLFYGHLSTAPQSLLREMIIYSYKDIGIATNIPPLSEVTNIKLRRLTINLSKRGKVPMRLKWFAEKYIEPMIESCPVSRNQAMGDGEKCLVSRNEPMHDSVKYLQNRLKRDTDILHEYFIPRSEFITYVDGVRTIIEEHDVNLLNASVRVVHKEDNFLNYASEDMFSIVLYINQTADKRGNEKMEKVTRKLIDLTIAHNGKFFLPYQLHYTKEALKQAYPEIDTFFSAKRRYDLDERFMNTFYEKYGMDYGTNSIRSSLLES